MNHKPKLFIILLLVLVCNSLAKAGVYKSVKEIAQRRTPWLEKALVFSTIPSENGKDVFELDAKDGKVFIAASSSISAAEALGWYLRYYCKRSISHLGDNLSPVGKLPEIKEKIRIISPYKFRYALNYCTISYSMSFYRWKDWERELDWMALNGINLALAPLGMEAVWQNTLKRVGYSERETLSFIPGPAFGAWWLMGNLEGWGGPVSQSMILQQLKLAKKVVQRMQELKIEPVLSGFYGMVPTTLKNKIKVNVLSQGKWAGGFQRPDFLLPTDPVFKKVAEIYYSEIKNLFGANIHFFAGDPFHEGGNPGTVDQSFAAKAIQYKMQQTFPESIWVLQGWQSNPSEGLLRGVNKQKTLVIELFGENTNNWEKRKGYDQTPFIWSNVSNFGEKTGLYGKLQRFSDEVYRARNSEYGNYLNGIGIIPEGINNNPVAYDFMLQLGWHKEKILVDDWIEKYQLYRYGKTNANLRQAWKILLETVYSSPDINQEGPSESIFCSRPGIDINTVSSWGTRKRNYDELKFLQAVRLFVASNKDFVDVETYKTDKIDFVRQVLANKGDLVYKKMMSAIKDNDVEAFRRESSRFQLMILQQDSLLGTSRYFTVNHWLKQAIDFGSNHHDKALALKNAKVQITYWGPDDNPKTELHEYAHKEWNGLLGSLYVERWKKFSAYQIAKMMGSPTEAPNYFTMEKVWVNDQQLYLPKIISDHQVDELIANILR